MLNYGPNWAQWQSRQKLKVRMLHVFGMGEEPQESRIIASVPTSHLFGTPGKMAQVI